MIVALRVDASIEIGSGHVMRCITLARSLSEVGARCVFISRLLPGNLIGLIEANGFQCICLPPIDDSAMESSSLTPGGEIQWLRENWGIDAKQTLLALDKLEIDWLVVDHYSFDIRWERWVAYPSSRLMVIDDLADRQHYCQILLDQNIGRTASNYESLVPGGCNILAGSSFALLDRQFERFRSLSLSRRLEGRLEQLLLSMGGSDQSNMTEKVLRTIYEKKLMTGMQITVIMGPNAPHYQRVERLASESSSVTRVLKSVTNMPEIMAESDFAIGAAGTSALERCSLGLPSAIFSLAENQKYVADSLLSRHAAVVLKTPNDLIGLNRFFGADTPERNYLQDLSKHSASLVDGKGVERVLEAFGALH